MKLPGCKKRRNKAKEELLPQKESVATQRVENRGEYQKNTTQKAPRGCQWEGQRERRRWQNSCNSSVCPSPTLISLLQLGLSTLHPCPVIICRCYLPSRCCNLWDPKAYSHPALAALPPPACPGLKVPEKGAKDGGTQELREGRAESWIHMAARSWGELFWQLEK